MKLWVLTVGEPTSVDDGNPRFLRSGVLADMAARAGHQVTWWTSTVEHMNKKLRFEKSTLVEERPGFQVCYLHGGMYQGNISPSRLLNHARVAREFLRLVPGMERPDVIFSSLPLIELSVAAARYRLKAGCKVVLDVRDFWPDIWYGRRSGFQRGLVKAASMPWEAGLRYAVRRADAVFGFTDEAVDWALDKAGRRRTPADLAFPFAYPTIEVGLEPRAEAELFWERNGLKAEKATLCFIGSISATTEAGLRSLAKAVRKLPEATRGRLQVVVAGTGEFLDALRRETADLPQFFWPGWIDAPKIQTLMERSDAGLLPYPNSYDFLRSIPNKVPEYLSAGLPILTSLGGVVGKLVTERQCGVAYPDGDDGALPALLAKVASRQLDLDRMGANSAALYQERFTPDAVYGGLIGALEQMAR